MTVTLTMVEDIYAYGLRSI